ncbi:hypothetical protein E2C01_084412 [Portunus trituberculatus]|uniref:Uncharacterized protein n=1 Tax=Portunus trituberculatus TaxID=210409 RepID=A0A5B7IZX0_PORTR|nr:hypothetical protein [Portunus trituberculatus]
MFRLNSCIGGGSFPITGLATEFNVELLVFVLSCFSFFLAGTQMEILYVAGNSVDFYSLM